MAVNREKLLARLNIDTSSITQKLKALNTDFSNTGSVIKHTFSEIRDASGEVIRKITTDFTELSNQTTRITKTIESLNKTGEWETSTIISDTNLKNQKKYFEMLKNWWAELSQEQRNSISLLKTYQERLGHLAAQSPDNSTKGQILKVKSSIDNTVDTAVLQAQKTVHSEIARLLTEQYSLQVQIQRAGDNERPILQEKLNLVIEDLAVYQALLSTHTSLLKNKEFEGLIDKAQLNVEQQKKKALDQQTAILDERNQKANDYFQKNKETLALLNEQTVALQQQALNEALYPTKTKIDSSTVEGKIKNSFVYFTSGMLQSSMWQVFQSSLSAVSAYETGIASLRRTMQGVTENELKNLGETAINYAKEFGLSLNQVQDTMVELSRAGINDSSTLKELTKAVSIGVNTTEISSASDMVSYLISTIKQLKLEFSDSMEIIDTWNYLADQYAVHTNDFAEAIQRSGSASRALGLDLYDVNALVTILGEATQSSGNMIGTALKAMEVRLMRQDTVAVLESYGIAVKKNADEFLSFREILDNVYDRLKNLNENSVAYQDIVQSMGGSFRANWVTTLVSDWEKFDELVKEQKDAAGYATEQNAKVMDTLAKKVEQCKESFLSLFIEVANETGITEFLKNTTDSLSAFLQSLKDSGILKFVVEVGKMILVFKAAMIPLKLLTKTLGIDLVKAIKSLVSAGISKVFKTDGINLYDKAVQRIQKNLEKANVPLGEQIALLKKIDARLGTNIAGKLEFEEKSKAINLSNDKLKTHITMCDESINQQLKMSDSTKDYTDTINELANCDKILLDQKLQELNLSDEQRVVIKEQVVQRQDLNTQLETNKTNLEAIKVATGQNTTVLQTNKAALIGAKAATVALTIAQQALQMAMSFGIGLAISFLFQGISSLINKEKDMRKETVKAAQSLNEETESLEKQRKKIIEYTSVLDDSTASLEETADARKSLLEIQQELIEQYGKEAEAIDLLNTKSNQQKITVMDLEKAQADSFLRENRKSIRKADDYLTKSGIENINTYFWSAGKAWENNRNIFKKYGSMDSEGNYYVEGTYEERIEKLQAIYDEIESTADEKGLSGKKTTYKQLEKLSEQISKLKNKDKYKENLEIFDTTGKARFISEYTSLYSDILDAQSEFDEAYASGDQKRIDEALDKLVEFKENALNTSNDAAVKKYVEEELFSLYNATIESAVTMRDNLKSVFSENVYNEVLNSYGTSILNQLNNLTDYFSDFFGSNQNSIMDFLQNIGVDINNLSYDLLAAINNFSDLFENSETALEYLDKISLSASDSWNSISDSAENCGLTYEEFYRQAILGATNLDKHMEQISNTVLLLKERVVETVKESNDWIATAKSVKDLDKTSRDYYNTIREIALEYPELVVGIDEVTGAYILAEDYEERIIQKQKELVEEQNNLLEKQYLSALVAAQSYLDIAEGDEAIAKATEALAEAQDNYNLFLITKGSVYDSSAADAIEAATKRVTAAIEAATKALDQYNRAIALLGEIDTEEEKKIQADLLAAQYAETLNQILLLEQELQTANESDIEAIADKIQELKVLKIGIEDTTKALVQQTYEQQKQNELTQIQIDKTNALLELEKNLYGDEGKEAYEERIRRQLDAIQNAENAEIVTILAQAYMDGDEARIAALREILDVQEEITDQSEKQLELEKLKLELENARRNLTTQLLTKDENGNWQYTYTYDYAKVSDLEEKIAQAEKDYVSEQINQELDKFSELFEKESKIIEASYEDLKIQTEIFYNDMSRLVEDKFNEISEDIASALVTMTEAAMTADKIAIALAEWMLRTQLSDYDGTVLASLIDTATQANSFDTGGYTGNNEGLAYLHAKERVLTAKQTLDFERLVAYLPQLVTAIPDPKTFTESLKSYVVNNTDNKQYNKTEIHIDRLEFPNIASSEGLRDAILSLPTVATQY